MNRDTHIGGDAELYAAGALTPEERVAVDAHIAGCSECLRRVGEAEETVLALERVTAIPPIGMRGAKVLPFQRPRVSVWWVAVAAAAALILGLLIPHGAPQGDVATLAMLHSHFAHAQFTGNGPAAKVIYARDRSWYYVIVAGGHRFEVYGLHAETAGGVRIIGETDLGATTPTSYASRLFASASKGSAFEYKRFDKIELRDHGRVIETATVR